MYFQYNCISMYLCLFKKLYYLKCLNIQKNMYIYFNEFSWFYFNSFKLSYLIIKTMKNVNNISHTF